MKTTTSFKDRVYRITANIPKGKVATYGQIAKIAGVSGAARAVGNAMRTNTDTKAVPCHRVVGATGALTGYAYGNGLSTKRTMLKKEGVVFTGDRVDLSLSGWKG
jgi:methylated-DNA-protein-cysteine methyltransferase-like protein